MPQINFGQAFSDPPKAAAPPLEQDSVPPSFPQNLSGAAAEKPASASLAASGWANILFATISLGGGLFCLFYFFHGGELWRSAASWPREIFYGRSASSGEEFNRVARVELSPSGKTGEGDPFSRMDGLIALNQPVRRFARATPGLSGGGSVLSHLGLPAPGGDALLQALYHGPADSLRSDAQRTIAALPKSAPKIEKRAINGVRTSVKKVEGSAGHAPGQVISRPGTGPATALPMARARTDPSAPASGSVHGNVSGLTNDVSDGRGGGTTGGLGLEGRAPSGGRH